MYQIVLLAKRIKKKGYVVYTPSTDRYESLLYFDNGRACGVQWVEHLKKYVFYGCYLAGDSIQTWKVGEFGFHDTIGKETLDKMLNVSYPWWWLPKPNYLDVDNFISSGQRNGGLWKKYDAYKERR